MKEKLKIACGARCLTQKSESAPKITQVFAFGDSYSDNGAAQRISATIMKDPNRSPEAYLKPADPQQNLYWEGRYSNGITAVEVLAQKIGVSLTDYAVGGATSGEENYSSWMDVNQKTGVMSQVQEFKNSLKGQKADANALYFIFAGINDYYKFMDYELAGTVEKVANQTVANISTAISHLQALGAHRFLVVNSPNLGYLPYEVVYQRTKAAGTFTVSVNTKLPVAVKQLEKKLSVAIVLFDIAASTEKIISNPGQYNLVALSKPCERTYPAIEAAAANPDQYLFWDEYHLTSAAHKIYGEDMYTQIMTAFN